jgi:hypothetical protein
MYPAKVRFDTQPAISLLSARTKFCTEGDERAIRHFTAMLYTTMKVPLIFHCRQHNEPRIPQLTSAADAAYRTHRRDSHSHLGAVHKLGPIRGRNGAFAAISKKDQGVPAEHTPVAELKAVVEATKGDVYFREVLEEAGLKQEGPTPLEEDNDTVTAVVRDLSNKTKKMRNRMQMVHFVQGYEQAGIIAMVRVDTAKQTADLMTAKVIGPTEHWRKAPWVQGDSAEIREMQQRVGGRSRGVCKAEYDMGEAYDDESSGAVRALTAAVDSNTAVNESMKGNYARQATCERHTDEGRVCRRERKEWTRAEVCRANARTVTLASRYARVKTTKKTKLKTKMMANVWHKTSIENNRTWSQCIIIIIIIVPSLLHQSG